MILQLISYNPFLVYCRELAPGTVSLTCDRTQGDDSKHDSHYSRHIITPSVNLLTKAKKSEQCCAT